APDAAPAQSAPSDAPAPAGPTVAPAGSGTLTRAELEPVWAAAVLPSLKPGTKAVFGTGRFAEPDGSTAVLALANAPTRDHCEKKRPEVEAALTAALGRPVSLRLVTEADVAGPAPASGGAAAAAPASDASAPDDEEAIDVADLEDAPDATTGVDRLTEAFPGSELVDEP
ncbi:MAG: hypothetical protein ACSLFP_11500, partial [Acidimicrobiales bacterium]